MFTWIPIYTEIAEKLLKFRSNRKDLIDLLLEMGKDNLKVISLNDKRSKGLDKKTIIEDIDPFTFFVNFNRKITVANRQTLLERFKTQWGLVSPIPTDFNGLPAITPQNAWFFAYKYDRGKNDIHNLWELYQQVMERKPEDVESKLFNKCLTQRGIKQKITAGLFWIKPNDFFPLVGGVEKYLNEKYGIDETRIVELKFTGYLELLDTIRSKTKMPFYKISQEAYMYHRKEGDLLEKLLKSTRYKKFKENDLANKIEREQKAWNLIQSSKGKISKDIIREMMDKVDTYEDRNGVYKSGWFGSLVRGNNRNNILDVSSERLNEWVNTLLYSDLGYEDAIKKCMNELKIVGASRGFASLLLYLSNPYKFNVFIPKTATEAFKLLGKGINKYKGVKQYEEFNNQAIEIREKYNLKPQEMDWIFSQISNFDETEDNGKTSSEKNVMDNKKFGLNSILYGPPGTGKTYETVSRAVQIIENLPLDALNKKYDSRTEIKNKYQEYLEKEQIKFVTFHQSFSYEDFIEGIKPRIEKEGEDTDENGDIKYVIEDGVFKDIVNKAVAARTKKVSSDNYYIDESKFKNAGYFKMSLGNTAIDDEIKNYRYCIENDLIGLGYGYNIDFTGVKNEEDIRKRYEENGFKIESNNDYRLSSIKIFLTWLKEGDIVFVSNGNRKLRAVGKVKSDKYIFKKESPISYHQFREVEWLLKDVDIPVQSFYYKNFSQQTIYQMFTDKVDHTLFTKAEKNREDINKYVLIIDEINRGNIASIFGELITLIEEDKRLGAPEALSTELPYSKESFEVPDNLYLVGTMNTADRSVEALDTALRRRFEFEEINANTSLINPSALIMGLWNKHEDSNWDDEPFNSKAQKLYEFLGFADDNYELSEKYGDKIDKVNWNEFNWSETIPISEFNGFRVDKMLKVINLRIETILDNDHCIGHAYFMSLSDCYDPIIELKRIFKNKILPLLQEYFYGDLAKIGLILGKNFVEYKYSEDIENIFAEFDYENIEEYQEKPIIQIKEIDSLDLDDFRSIYEQ